jgi:hypothetical protein
MVPPCKPSFNVNVRASTRLTNVRIACHDGSFPVISQCGECSYLMENYFWRLTETSINLRAG